MTRIGALIWKEFRQLKNDKLTLRLMIVPIFAQLFILGYALTTEVKHTPVAILDRSNTIQSRELTALINHNPLFKPTLPAQSEIEIRNRLDNGSLKVGVIVPPDFAVSLNRPAGATINLMIDGQDANSAMVAAGYLNAVISGWALHSFGVRLLKAGIRIEDLIPVRITTSVLFNPLLISSWYMVPAMAVILVTMITSLLTGFSIVKEKESGTLEQLLVTPLSTVQIIIGKTVPYVLIGVVELCVMLAAGALWFGIPFRGNALTLIFFTLLYMLSSLGIGILISTLARTAQQVLFLTWFVMIFFILLSGFFIPIENTPRWVQNITLFNPVRYYMFIIRDIFLKGSGFAELWQSGLRMVGIGAVVLSVAVVAFKRKIS